MCTRTKTANRASNAITIITILLLISVVTLYSMVVFAYDSDSRTNEDLRSLRLNNFDISTSFTFDCLTASA